MTPVAATRGISFSRKTIAYLGRDVYAEFLRHPPGVCNIVDLRTSGCRFCTRSVPGNVSGGENSDLENDPESYSVDRATGLENCEDHCDAGDATLDEVTP